MIRLEAVVAHERNFDALYTAQDGVSSSLQAPWATETHLKDGVPVVVHHLHHLRVVIPAVQNRTAQATSMRLQGMWAWAVGGAPLA